MRTYANTYGIECVMSSCGTCFSQVYIISPKTGKRIRLTGRAPVEYYELPWEFVQNDDVEVPIVCLNCAHYDAGEYGDFGDLLAGPQCTVQLYFPIRKGTCKRKARYIR